MDLKLLIRKDEIIAIYSDKEICRNLYSVYNRIKYFVTNRKDYFQSNLFNNIKSDIKKPGL